MGVMQEAKAAISEVPTWGWFAIGGAGLFLFLRHARGGTATASPAIPATPVDPNAVSTSGGGVTVVGSGGGGIEYVGDPASLAALQQLQNQYSTLNHSFLLDQQHLKAQEAAYNSSIFQIHKQEAGFIKQITDLRKTITDLQHSAAHSGIPGAPPPPSVPGTGGGSHSPPPVQPPPGQPAPATSGEPPNMPTTASYVNKGGQAIPYHENVHSHLAPPPPGPNDNRIRGPQ